MKKNSNTPPMGMPMDMEDHEGKSAADTLIKAEEIKSNKELFKRANKHLQTKKKHITSVAQLRQIAAEKAEDPAEESAESPEMEASEPFEAPLKKKKA